MGPGNPVHLAVTPASATGTRPDRHDRLARNESSRLEVAMAKRACVAAMVFVLFIVCLSAQTTSWRPTIVAQP